MPIYEYECKKCGKRYEHLLLSSDKTDDVRCPDCGASNSKRVLSVFAINSSPSFGGGQTCCGPDDPRNVSCDSPGSCCSGCNKF